MADTTIRGLDTNTVVELRFAFSDRRQKFLKAWFTSFENNMFYGGMTLNEYWAKRLMEVNDAELTVCNFLNCCWEEMERKY